MNGELYPGEMVPVDFLEAKTEGEDLEEDLTCDMILALMDKWEEAGFSLTAAEFLHRITRF